MSKRTIGLLSCCVVLLTACANQDMSDLHQFVEQVNARPPAPIEPLPELKQIETFVYDARNRRSPFSLGTVDEEEVLAESTNGISPPEGHVKQELENYPLDSIRMVGTLEQEMDMWALVSIQDGTLFRIQAGNYLGQNYGQITRIAEDRIELTEIVTDGAGGWQERQASIALSE